MAKINPLLGKGTGKVGAFLLQVNSGVQILKEKPVKVANPNTDAQIAQRAKLKLMSQLAADLSQTIGFQKKGLVSARNQFISANIGKCVFTDGEANVSFENLDLTGGSINIANPTFGDAGAVQIAEAVPENVKGILYALYREDPESQLQLIEQKIINEAGANRTFPTTFAGAEKGDICFAYGLAGNGSAALVDYENYVASIEQYEAILSTVRSVVVKGGTLTRSVAAWKQGS